MLKFLLVLIALAVPWLSPWTLGPTTAFVQTYVTLFLACGLIVYAGTSAWFTGRNFAYLVATSWLLAAGLSAVIGLLQYFGLSAAFSNWMDVSGLGVAYGNLRQRNQFATLLNMGLAATLWLQMLVMSRWPALQQSKLRRRLGLAVVALLLVLMATALAASSSRTGLLQLVLLVVLSILWRRPDGPQGLASPLKWLGLAMLVYVVMSFALPWLAGFEGGQLGVWARLREGEAGCSSRTVLWSNVIELIAQKPWTGWGAGELAYAHFEHLYAGPRFCEILDNAHSLPLHVAVTGGIPLAAAFCLLILAALFKGKPWREVDPERQLAWAVLALIGVHSLLEYPLWYAPFQMGLLCAGLIWCRGAQRQVLLGSALSQVLAGLVFVLACYCTWDYWRISQIYLSVPERAPAYRDDTLRKIQDSWLFHTQVQFAQLSVVPLTAENAAEQLAWSKELLHYSPEPMVLERLLEAAQLLGRQDDIAYYSLRYRIAYPQMYTQWQSPASEEQ